MTILSWDSRKHCNKNFSFKDWMREWVRAECVSLNCSARLFSHGESCFPLRRDQYRKRTGQDHLKHTLTLKPIPRQMQCSSCVLIWSIWFSFLFRHISWKTIWWIQDNDSTSWLTLNVCNLADHCPNTLIGFGEKQPNSAPKWWCIFKGKPGC